MSITVFRIKGIPIRIHITFLLIVPWLSSQQSAYAGTSMISEAVFVLAIFCCILLHELGHALMARRFGIGTRDITLYPFGGIASLNRDTDGFAELCISIAGPLVNVAIAGLIFGFFLFISEYPAYPYYLFPHRLLAVNLFLAVFNMVPAFPMDGGRVLRAVLQLLGVRRATYFSARLGQLLCLIMGLYALNIGSVTLLLVSIVVFSSAGQHYRYELRKQGLE